MAQDRGAPLLLAALLALAAVATTIAWSLLDHRGSPPEAAAVVGALRLALWIGAALQLSWALLPPSFLVRTHRKVIELERRWTGWPEPWGVGLIVAAFAATWSMASVARHLRFNSMGYDLAIQDQVIWSLANGKGFAASIEVENYLGDHFSPVMALVAPWYWIWEDPRCLLILQSCWLALGAIAVWRLARIQFRSPALALLFAAGYAVTPAVGYAAKYDFHIVTLAIPVLLWAVVAWAEGRRGLWCLLLLGSLGIREEIGLTVAGFGVLALWRSGWRQVGLLAVVVGLAYSAAALFVWIPYFRGEGSDTLSRYAYLGGDAREIVTTLIREPWRPLVRQLAHTRRAMFFIQLALPSGGLALLAPAAWGPGLINLGQNFASDNMAQASIYFHYSASYLGFAIWAGVRGAARAWKLLPGVRGRGALVLLLLWGPLAATSMDRALLEPVLRPYSQVYGLEHITDGTAFAQVRKLIEPDESVLASEPFAPHLSHRERIYVYHTRQEHPWDVDWVLVDLGSTRYLEDPAWLAQEVEEWLHQRGYRLRAFVGEVVVLSRHGAENAAARSAWDRRIRGGAGPKSEPGEDPDPLRVG